MSSCPPDDASVEIAAGSFLMGTDDPRGYAADGEGPVHTVELSRFALGLFPVTNARFADFVAATRHRTTAERTGSSFVFAGLLPDDFPPTRGVSSAPWWRQVRGADWAHPEGSHSDVRDRRGHPVVHVSWFDATAFCEWSGTRLPTEAQWERAARGGREGHHFPWGDEREPGGVHRMNVYQGRFPHRDDGDDGWVGTSPVGSYPPNDLGLHDMTGNVWEWCADWFDPEYYRRGGGEPARTCVGTRSGAPRRLLPVSRELLLAVPGRRPQLGHAREHRWEHRLPGGDVALNPRRI